jgi:hypothetical protein
MFAAVADVKTCLAGTGRITLPILEQRPILILKIILRNKTSRFCRQEKLFKI